MNELERFFGRGPDDEAFMEKALLEAEIAAEEGEVPVGALVVHEGRIIGRGHNQRERLNDPTAHAEMIAITQGASALDSWRLLETTLYVTLEPCPMCAGAILLARVPRIVFGAEDPKLGACGSTVDLLADPHFDHQPEVKRGILAARSKALIQQFFRSRRDASP
jgi:tRNA(adenine34) deaminase